MKIKVKLADVLAYLPKKSDEGAAAYDLAAPMTVELKRGRQIVDLGFQMELPHGYGANIQPRSGFSAKGFEVTLVPRFCLPFLHTRTKRVDADVILGLVDENYRDNVGVIIKSRYRSIFYKAYIARGTRIAQMRISSIPKTEIEQVDELDMSNDRGGGFGHSGTKSKK
jgi:dUTP pyrophosphatase